VKISRTSQQTAGRLVGLALNSGANAMMHVSILLEPMFYVLSLSALVKFGIRVVLYH
jgi:uncharacterized RmlC-like cupin family protein